MFPSLIAQTPLLVTPREAKLTMATPTITIIGSLNYDVVTTAERIPSAGETIAALDFATHNGGKGSNQALACARLRPSSDAATVRMVGCVGNDTFGVKIKQALCYAGVSVDLVKTKLETVTGVATILVEAATGQNRILVFPGANALIETDDVLNACENTDTLVLQNEIPVSIVAKAIEKIAGFSSQDKKTPLVVYNPSPIDESFPKELYKHVSCLVLNSTEARAIVSDEHVRALLTNDDDAEQALVAIKPIAQHLSLPRYIVITLGAAGCVYYDTKAATDPVHVPAKKPLNPIIDTTGAGDTFLGALTSQLTCSSTLEAAINVASAASSIGITRKGAGDSIPVYSELSL